MAHLREIHKRAKNKTAGFVIHLGDSITHYKGYSQFALNCQATDELGQAVKWSKAGGPDTDQAAPDCKNGWSLSYTQVKSDKPRRRSYTACKGITVHEFLYGATKAYCFVAGPEDRAPLDTLLNNTSTAPVGGPNGYPVAVVADAQIAVIMLGTNDIGGSAAIDKRNSDCPQIKGFAATAGLAAKSTACAGAPWTSMSSRSRPMATRMARPTTAITPVRSTSPWWPVLRPGAITIIPAWATVLSMPVWPAPHPRPWKPSISSAGPYDCPRDWPGAWMSASMPLLPTPRSWTAWP
ncbi:MAG: hypothetical protein ABIF71_03090, partial [Planctomycetota bacterium]